MPSKREREIKKLLYTKNELIKQTKKEIKVLRLELNKIQNKGGKKYGKT